MLELIRNIIVAAALLHNVSAPGMLGVADCESSYRPYVTNGRYIGLYQLGSPGELDTFYSYGYNDPFNADQQANFVAQRISEGGLRAWSCKYRYYTG